MTFVAGCAGYPGRSETSLLSARRVPEQETAAKRVDESVVQIDFQSRGDLPPAPAESGTTIATESVPESGSEADAVESLELTDIVAGLTLEALQELGLANNPSIRQGSAAANRASGIETQVGLRPNPRIGYFGQEIGIASTAGQHGAFVSQMFVTGAKLDLNRCVVGQDKEAVLWLVEAQRYRVRTDIRTRFYAALAAQERVRLAREFRTVAQEGVRIATERLAAEVGTRPDILQSEIQVSEVGLSIRRAELDLESAWKELTAAVGLPNMPRTQLLGVLGGTAGAPDPDVVWAQIEAESPLIRSAEAQVRRARLYLRRQQAQPTPNLTGQLGAGYDDGTDSSFANVQLSVPLPAHNQNQGNVTAAHAALCEATENVRRVRMQLRAELARVMRDYLAASVTVQQYEATIIPKANETLELVLKAQEAGEIGFLRVLTARRSVFDVNQRYVSALAQQAQAQARIDGLLLTGGLSNVPTFDGTDELRGQALNGR